MMVHQLLLTYAVLGVFIPSRTIFHSNLVTVCAAALVVTLRIAPTYVLKTHLESGLELDRPGIQYSMPMCWPRRKGALSVT